MEYLQELQDFDTVLGNCQENPAIFCSGIDLLDVLDAYRMDQPANEDLSKNHLEVNLEMEQVVFSSIYAVSDG